MEKKEYICELQFNRTLWVFKIVRLVIHKGRFLEIGIFVGEKSVFVGCWYFGKFIGYGVEFLKMKDVDEQIHFFEGDFTS